MFRPYGTLVIGSGIIVHGLKSVFSMLRADGSRCAIGSCYAIPEQDLVQYGRSIVNTDFTPQMMSYDRRSPVECFCSELVRYGRNIVNADFSPLIMRYDRLSPVRTGHRKCSNPV